MTSSHLKPVIRSAVAAWLSLILLLISEIDQYMGQVGLWVPKPDFLAKLTSIQTSFIIMIGACCTRKFDLLHESTADNLDSCMSISAVRPFRSRSGARSDYHNPRDHSFCVIDFHLFMPSAFDPRKCKCRWSCLGIKLASYARTEYVLSADPDEVFSGKYIEALVSTLVQTFRFKPVSSFT